MLEQTGPNTSELQHNSILQLKEEWKAQADESKRQNGQKKMKVFVTEKFQRKSNTEEEVWWYGGTASCGGGLCCSCSLSPVGHNMLPQTDPGSDGVFLLIFQSEETFRPNVAFCLQSTEILLKHFGVICYSLM